MFLLAVYGFLMTIYSDRIQSTPHDDLILVLNQNYKKFGYNF